MNNICRYKFKKGAASFYIVAFATLILMIIAVSFASIIISEMNRTSKDDLAQSAYDSALAGVEDAKLAFSNYKKCVASGATAKEPVSDAPLDCSAIVWYMEHPDCNMVGKILGRGEGEVAVQESSVHGNNMQQFYTCVKINKNPSDYRATVSSIKAVKVKFADGVDANKIKTVRFSWFSDANSTDFKYSNISGDKVTFPASNYTFEAKPPTVFLAMVQTANTFQMDSFDMTVGQQTNRGMLYFVPTQNTSVASSNGNRDNHLAGYDQVSGTNHVGVNGFLKSNDKTIRNLPYVVYCPENSGQEFACTVDIDLPEPIGGGRSNETFMFVVGMPYGKSTTNDSAEISLEFLCEEGEICSKQTVEEGSEESSGSNVATLDGVQIEIDSTGRANDLYRRVKARLQSSGAYDLSIMGPLELLGTNNNSNPLLNKNYSPICEWNFPNRGC